MFHVELSGRCWLRSLTTKVQIRMFHVEQFIPPVAEVWYRIIPRLCLRLGEVNRTPKEARGGSSLEPAKF